MTRADRYEPPPDDAGARWVKFGQSETVFYPMLLGLEVEEVRIDYCRMRIPFKPELLQPGGVVRGGAIASLMDAVLVPAEGWVTKRGCTVVFCESEALGTTSGRPIARSVLAYNVSPAPS